MWVVMCGRRSNFIRRGTMVLLDRGLLDDFVQSLIVAFMDQYGSGKTPMFRPLWILYELDHYLSPERRRFQREELIDPHVLQSEDEEEEVGREVGTRSEAIAAHFQMIDDRFGLDPYRGTLYRELHNQMVKNGQHMQLLELRSDLTFHDLWLLRGETKRYLGDSILSQAFGMDFALEWMRLWAVHMEEKGYGT
jgi:hypothetical protein